VTFGVACAALVAAEVAAGVFFGFGGISHLVFWSFVILLVPVAWMLTPASFDASVEPAEPCVRAAVTAFAIVVAIGLVLGAAARMTVAGYLAAEAAVLSVVAWWTRSHKARHATDVGGGHWAAWGFWVAIVAFVIGMGISNSPYTAYDAVSYHLYFPARWLQAHRLLIVPTPFSDEAQAYQPGNGELWFLWLMLPFHGDFLARIGQMPFYLLGAAVSYLLALRCGVSRFQALYAPTLFLMAPPIAEQAVGANVDLIAAVMFVAAIYFSVVAIDSDRPRDWAMWGIATGLFVGTKYLAVVYAPVLVIAAMLRGIRPRALWGLPGILALGAPWYVRNWLVAGSPLYPATLTIGGLTLGRGAYTHAAMLRSFMHTTDPRLLGVSLIHAFGTPFAIAFAPIAAVAIVMTLSRFRGWPAAAIAVSLVGVVALCWMTVGDNTDARFLLPAVALFPAVVPLAFGARRGVNTVLHVWLIAGVAWVLVGVDRQLNPPLPWFMADWLPLHGILDPEFTVVFVILAITAMTVCAVAMRRRAVAAAAVAMIAVAGATLAIGAERWCLPGRCEYVQFDNPHIRSAFVYGARWFTENVHGANVAYAGINLPYLLSGKRLTNTVRYVNIDNHLSWRFDQYAAAYQQGTLQATGPPLATPSGVLMPADGADAIRPRFERRAGDPDEWKMNLARERIAYLFVMRLDPYEVDYNRHDAQGFPVEDEWARSDPKEFRLAYSNEEIRIYEVSLPMTDFAR
jgi:hypothetical protein